MLKPTSEPIDYRALMQDAWKELKRLNAQLDAEQRARTEPVAVIGLGCRFPGASDPEAYWQMLRAGRSAIGEVPADRWDVDRFYDPNPDAPGKMSSRLGGFLEHIDQFDCRFFGIAPCEARSLDPQQRLLLEVGWEAFEHAGLPPDKLHGTSTGVFIGISSNEFSQLLRRDADVTTIDSYFGTGNSMSVAAGRLSYVWGLQGPAIAVDTACSSSLVAVHLAVRSLRSGECRLALAGGVNLMLAPETTINFSKAHMLAADGRCKTFDAAADGYVRGEGCGVVLLKRLSDARADGDRILAVIRGTAVNHDGRSAGLTAPNGPAQEAVIRAALAEARLEPDQVDYIEAHGTGTSLGDPIEVGALVNTFGARAGGRPLLIGSVKTNIGHLEAAAGVAGLIKAVLSLERGEIPPHLNFTRWNPHIRPEQDAVAIPLVPTKWPEKSAPSVAGISSFSFSGTNAHVVIEGLFNVPPPMAESLFHDSQVLTLSAKTRPVLVELALRYARFLAEAGAPSWPNICYTACLGRSHFSHRLALVADSRAAATQLLAGFAAGEHSPNVLEGVVSPGALSAGDVAEPVDSSDPAASHLARARRFIRGAAVDWSAWFGAQHVRRVSLPTYPFQRERFWLEANVQSQGSSGLLGRRVDSMLPTFETSLAAPNWAFVEDHRVYGVSVVPGAAWLELALAAAATLPATANWELADVEFHQMAVLPAGRAVRVQTLLLPESHGSFRFQIHGAPAASEHASSRAILHASGAIIPSPAVSAITPATESLAEIRGRLVQSMAAEQFYDRLDRHGLNYGPGFRCIQQIELADGEALGLVVAPEGGPPLSEACQFPPALLDACLQTLAAAISPAALQASGANAYLPVGVRSLKVHRAVPDRMWSHARIQSPSPDSPQSLLADVRIFNESGELIAELLELRFEGFQARSASRRSAKAPSVRPDCSAPNSSNPVAPNGDSTEKKLTRASLLSAPASERQHLLEQHLHNRLATILEMPPTALGRNEPLLNLGLDSLMVFSLGTQLEVALGVQVDMQDLLAGPSVAELTSLLLSKLEGTN
ncbi:MAG TPA: beta-ketoacyl synthase N-terminal-like domain-containing protein [Pirellulales bacterium]|jgi:acyl transferase domain-containing protein|nr:beta-ketoacyl synthase N-terminal-like domain-containing protein [Pirellulales bacterium]